MKIAISAESTIDLTKELLEKYKTRDEIAEVLKNRCNELGRLDHTQFSK